MDVDELAGRVRRKVELRRRELEQDPRFLELREEERFLERLEAHMADPGQKPHQSAQPPNTSPAATNGNGGLRRMKAGEKGQALVALVVEHGRQKPRDLRERLRLQGIDPDAGTEVKRVLWQLVKDGQLERDRATGEYGPVRTQNGASPAEEELKL